MLQNIITNLLMERSYNEKEYPAWLLFETENSLLIRDTQYDLLKTMLEDKENSIYQLNMGEGKTSVILVILNQMLADGKNISRINCLELLMGVMQELLRNKFRGLLQKKIYVMPFSREVVFDTGNVKKITEMLTECKNRKHVLLVTPEQRLCFQLKKQETFLEYLQSKDADDLFDWERHNDHHKYTHLANNKNPYILTEFQVVLRQALETLGYINSNNKILKYPSEGYNTFQEQVDHEISNISSQKEYHARPNVNATFVILWYNSRQLKTHLEQQIGLLYSIDEFKFFDILDESDEILRHGKELN
ncbi:unnamed protein product [Didymodactylos carnosus]|uniref:ubiquitinyl hydrolase 1 n=1 Tax=Didymodactylos carnosus TaxID=1234261 RepID=A0A815SPD5_9BILA|nr:unnamed protein product [Didymodactylos carnosus]CAF4356902.1 unnamed protein product [Didymodactylos carnosus]